MPKHYTNIAYICDKKACGLVCPSADFCDHTTDPKHSLTFKQTGDFPKPEDLTYIGEGKFWEGEIPA